MEATTKTGVGHHLLGPLLAKLVIFFVIKPAQPSASSVFLKEGATIRDVPP